jgi:hypothetical protein
MKLDDILIYAPGVAGKPNRARKDIYLTAIGTFLRFCQRNGLVRRTLIKSKKGKAPVSTMVCQAAFRDEGLKLFKSVYEKWLRVTDEGDVSPDDSRFLENALGWIRGTPGASRPRAVSGHGSIKKKKAGQAKLSKRVERKEAGSSLREPLTVDEEREFKAAGPHVYDKAKWHFEGEFPDGLSERQAYVHTGMYIHWLIEANLIADEFRGETELVKRGKIKGWQIYRNWGGLFASDMLTRLGNQFTRYYYEERYFHDYEERLAEGLRSFYHVKESAENYRVIRDKIQERFERWRIRRRKYMARNRTAK